MTDNYKHIDLNFALDQVNLVLDKETEVANTFVEMLKDEINSIDEIEIYNNVKKLINKYKDDNNSIRLIDEVISALTDGASMTEILLVARDEVIEPTTIDDLDMEDIDIDVFDDEIH